MPQSMPSIHAYYPISPIASIYLSCRGFTHSLNSFIDATRLALLLHVSDSVVTRMPVGGVILERAVGWVAACVASTDYRARLVCDHSVRSLTWMCSVVLVNNVFGMVKEAIHVRFLVVCRPRALSISTGMRRSRRDSPFYEQAT